MNLEMLLYACVGVLLCFFFIQGGCLHNEKFNMTSTSGNPYPILNTCPPGTYVSFDANGEVCVCSKTQIPQWTFAHTFDVSANVLECLEPQTILIFRELQNLRIQIIVTLKYGQIS